jgi:hypothetical protein
LLWTPTFVLPSDGCQRPFNRWAERAYNLRDEQGRRLFLSVFEAVGIVHRSLRSQLAVPEISRCIVQEMPGIRMPNCRISVNEICSSPHRVRLSECALISPYSDQIRKEGNDGIGVASLTVVIAGPGAGVWRPQARKGACVEM